MTSIDEIALRIIEGRKADLSDEELARGFSCDVEFLRSYENLLKEVSTSWTAPREIGLSLETKRSVREHYGIQRELKPKMMDLRREEIRELVQEGVGTVGEIAERLGLMESTVRQYASGTGIRLPRQRWKKRRQRWKKRENYLLKPGIASLVERGLTLEEMANLQNPIITRERVRQCLIKSRQHERWKKRREEVSSLGMEKELGSLATCLIGVAIQKCEEEGDLAYGKALERHYSMSFRKRKNAISFDQVYELFRWYYLAKEEGTNCSITELSEASGIKQINIGRILRGVGLDVMYRPTDKVKRRTKTPKWKKEAIDMCFGLGIDNNDIGYFLNIPRWIVDQRFINIGKRKVNYPSVRGQCEFGEQFNYRAASQVYEALDLGFGVGETSELLDVSEKLIGYYEGNRKNIGTRIIEALDVMYSEVKHDKPYL